MKNNTSATKTKKNKVVSIKMEASFFFERAVRSMDRHRYDLALKYFRKAVEFEPKNPVNQCNLAGILSEMGRFEESNEVLQTVLDEIDADMTECHFYMANNYANMDNFAASEEALIRYLETEEDGPYIEEARDMLEMVSAELGRAPRAFEPKRTGVFAQHDYARTLMEEGKFAEASNMLEKAIREFPEFTAAQNNLALAYYYMGRMDQAMGMIKQVLDQDPGNIHGLCNLALFYHSLAEQEQLIELVAALKRIVPMHLEQSFKLATTMGILAEHQLAYVHFKKLIREGYDADPAVYHYAAVAAFHMKEYEEARKYWRLADKIDGESGVARFFLKQLEDMSANKENYPLLSYQYNLPFEEQFRQMNNSGGSLPEHVRKDPLIRSSFFWALRHGNEDTKLQVIQALGFIGDEEVVSVLRDFLQQTDQTDYLKKVALFVLRHLGATGPFTVCLGGKQIEIDGSQLTTELPSWEPAWQKVLDIALAGMNQRTDVIQQHDLQSLWIDFLTRMYPDVPSMGKAEGWAAALEYVIAKIHHRVFSQQDAANNYRVSISTVNKRIRIIEEVCQIQERMAKPLPHFLLK